MSLRDEIEKAIENCALRSGVTQQISGEPTQHYCEVLYLKRTIFSIPGFAPVAPKALPDTVGLWSRHGEPCVVGKMITQDGLWGHWLCDDDITKDCMVGSSNFPRGHWLPATLLIPPAKEPEPPKQTQEAWLVVDSTGQPCHVTVHYARAVDRMEAWNRNSVVGVPATVVRIPPLPMEETK